MGLYSSIGESSLASDLFMDEFFWQLQFLKCIVAILLAMNRYKYNLCHHCLLQSQNKNLSLEWEALVSFGNQSTIVWESDNQIVNNKFLNI